MRISLVHDLITTHTEGAADVHSERAFLCLRSGGLAGLGFVVNIMCSFKQLKHIAASPRRAHGNKAESKRVPGLYCCENVLEARRFLHCFPQALARQFAAADAFQVRAARRHIIQLLQWHKICNLAVHNVSTCTPDQDARLMAARYFL